MGQPTFNRLYDEYLEAVAENYEEKADSCDATDFEMRKDIFAMLNGSAQTLLYRKGREGRTFEEGIDFLKSWYN